MNVPASDMGKVNVEVIKNFDIKTVNAYMRKIYLEV